MIGFLSGQPKMMADHVLVVVGGVGYQVAVGPRLHSTLSQTDQCQLFISTYVREEKLDLFGFAQHEDKHLFEVLLGISGVGPKTALMIVDRGQAALTQAVQQAEVGFFTAIPRVGKKLGQKIIIELKSKLGSIQELSLGPRTAYEADLKAALIQLGFDDGTIDQFLLQTEVDAEAPLAISVKQALKILGSMR